MNTNTTDKVQVGDSTTGTSTSTTWLCPYTQPKAEQGWECPRCGRINAPWVRQCDCSRSNWTITCDHLYRPYQFENKEWWKDYVQCQSADSKSNTGESVTTWNINTGDGTAISSSNMDVGGSDYWNSATKAWVNVPKTFTNKFEEQINILQDQLNKLKETK